MRIAKAQVGQELVDKITGIAYKVDTTEKSAEGTVTKAKATEVIEEGDDREPKTVEITEANDVTFKVTKWVPDKDLHTASIVDGALVVDGQPVIMGSIVAKKILKVFPGTVVFTAEKNEDVDEVMDYTPSRDKFGSLGYISIGAEAINSSDTRVIYGVSKTREQEVEKDGEKVKETVFDFAKLYVLTNGRFTLIDLVDMAPWDEDEYYDEDEYDEDEDDRTELPEGFLGFDFSGAIMAQGDKYIYIPMTDSTSDTNYRMVRVTNRAELKGDVAMPGKLTAVTANRTSSRYLGKAVFSGLGFVKIGDVVIKSDKLTGYIYLVDVREKDDVHTYIMSTEDRNVRTITRKVTADRGEIFTVD